MTETATPMTIAPDYSSMFAELKATFDTGRTADLAWRADQLSALERMMVECEQEFLDALRADLGKHALEAWSTEVSYVAGDAAYCRKNLRKWSRRRSVPTPMAGLPGKSWLQPEPLGVVLIIGAWNYPLQLTLAGTAAAIAAGNCAVLKPSELAPETSKAVARLVPQYLDGDCIRVVEGAVPETTALLELPWDHILYTGSGHVGRIVMAAAAKHLTPVVAGPRRPVCAVHRQEVQASAQTALTPGPLPDRVRGPEYCEVGLSLGREPERGPWFCE